MTDVIYLYAEGNDFAPPLEDAVVRRLGELAASRRWSFFECWTVNQRRDEGWELGVNLAFHAVEGAALPKPWFADVEAVLDCASALGEELGLSFVLGLGLDGRAAEDLFDAATDRAEVERMIRDIIILPAYPPGWLRRTVRFDLEDGRPVASLGDHDVALGPLFSFVFSLANGERTVPDILRAVASSRLPGGRLDRTTDVLDAIRSLSRDGFVVLAEKRSPLPYYLSVAVGEQDARRAQEEVKRDGFDTNRDPRHR